MDGRTITNILNRLVTKRTRQEQALAMTLAEIEVYEAKAKELIHPSPKTDTPKK